METPRDTLWCLFHWNCDVFSCLFLCHCSLNSFRVFFVYLSYLFLFLPTSTTRRELLSQISSFSLYHRQSYQEKKISFGIFSLIVFVSFVLFIYVFTLLVCVVTCHVCRLQRRSSQTTPSGITWYCSQSVMSCLSFLKLECVSSSIDMSLLPVMSGGNYLASIV
jgi:hypothetical protein